MQFVSTLGRSRPAGFREAVLRGLADDGGLFVPAELHPMPASFLHGFHSLTLQEISFAVATAFIEREIAARDLHSIIETAINFDAPIHWFAPNIGGLELFHGPTFAFKDFGARFMAQVMSHFHKGSPELLILVATSGDTGAAVAHGFWRVPGIRVVILYPSRQVSNIQEQQFATLGENIIALEVNGTFDDCQLLVKQCFADPDLKQERRLTSANSINIARLIPQMFYYWHACAQTRTNVNSISVPSGNYGNLAAGLMAKRMGLPVRHFIAASNANDTVARYLKTGSFEPRHSIPTISNSMDVGNPGNFARILFLYHANREALLKDLMGYSFTDFETRAAIQEVQDKFHKIIDPHSAVAYLGLKKAARPGIFLETAHPGKFPEVVEMVLDQKIQVPDSLQANLKKKKLSIPLAPKLDDLKSFLFSLS